MDAAAALKKFQAQEAARIRSYTSKAGVTPPQKYAAGGAVKAKPVKGGTTINISVGAKEPQGQAPNPMAAMALANALKPKPPPVTMAPPQAPPQGGPPQGGAPMPQMGSPGLAGIAGGMVPGMKKGGRATALPMTAGALSGEGNPGR